MTGGNAGLDDEDEQAGGKRAKKSLLEEELARYGKGKGLRVGRGAGGKKKDESDVLAVLERFKGRLRAAVGSEEHGGEGSLEKDKESEENEADKAVEVDTDTAFLDHALQIEKADGEDEERTKAERDYEVIDPRVRGARAREEERVRKKRTGKGPGGRGRRAPTGISDERMSIN